jgi:FixJ family two-component response regulator
MNEAAKIYLIDDDEAVRRSMAVLLEAHGYQTVEFALSREFLDAAELHGVGVVVADLIMPEISGEQLQERLIAAESTLSVVMVSGTADVNTAVRVIQRGALTLLEKPFAHEELFEAIAAGIIRSRSLVEQRARAAATAQALNALGSEERELLNHLLLGATLETCSTELKTSISAVEQRVRELLARFQVNSVGELAVLVDKILPKGE